MNNYNRLLLLVGVYSFSMAAEPYVIGDVQNEEGGLTEEFINRLPLDVVTKENALQQMGGIILSGDNARALKRLFSHFPQDLNKPVKRNETLLYMAAKHNREKCVKLLLKKGAVSDIGVGPKVPIHVAAAHNHTEVVRLLLKGGANPNTNMYNEPLLFTAAKKGFLGVVRELLAAGADPNRTTFNEFNLDAPRYTPLQAAALYGHMSIADELIKAGANLDVSIDGNSPADLAMQAGYRDFAFWLQDKGVKLQLKVFLERPGKKTEEKDTS